MLQKIINFLSHIPFIGPVFSFPWAVNRVAFFQLFFLWLLSSIPVIFSIVDKTVAGVDINIAIREMLNIRVVFLYTAAFISPLLYMLIDRLIYPKKEKIFHGAGLIFLVALFIFAGSAWAYGNDSFSDKNIIEDVFTRYSYYIYALSIYFWFLAIADTCNNGRDYLEIINDQTDDFIRATRAKGKEND